MPPCLEIFSLSVSHKARGLGIGALLCNHVEKLAKEQNVDLYLGKYDKFSVEPTQFVNMATMMLMTLKTATNTFCLQHRCFRNFNSSNSRNKIV